MQDKNYIDLKARLFEKQKALVSEGIISKFSELLNKSEVAKLLDISRYRVYEMEFKLGFDEFGLTTIENISKGLTFKEDMRGFPTANEIAKLRNENRKLRDKNNRLKNKLNKFDKPFEYEVVSAKAETA